MSAFRYPLSARKPGLNPRYKRPFDLTVLVVAHLVLFWLWIPLWILVPVAIWIEDRGPIFYGQKRMGKGGRVFRLLKFRSMVTNAEATSGAIWASNHDPRVTKIGRILRATALDELPQILLIWKGAMSLVGPRPERPELAAEFAKDLPEFAQRLQITPGLTGPAQVYGQYDSSPEEKLVYDLWYVENANTWVDIKLLVLSVWITLKGRWETRDNKI